jgi:hypothetical protein
MFRILARLDEKLPPAADAAAAAELCRLRADDEIRIKVGPAHRVRQPGRGRALAVRAADRHALKVLHQHAEHLGVFQHANVVCAGQLQFRVIGRDGGRSEDELRVRIDHRRVGLVVTHARAELGEPLRGRRAILVGAADARADAQQDRGEPGHAAPADPDQVHVRSAKVAHGDLRAIAKQVRQSHSEAHVITPAASILRGLTARSV